MHKKSKKFLSLALVLVMALAVLPKAALAKEAQAGDTTIKHSTGIEFSLSKPILGTKSTVFGAETGDPYPSQIYVIPSGTVVTPKPVGTLSPEAGRALAAGMGYTGEIDGEISIRYELFDLSGQGANREISEAGIEFTPEKITGDVPYAEDGVYMVECRLWVGGGWTRIFVGFEVVEDDTPTTPDQPTTLPTVENIAAAGTAVAQTQNVLLDGKTVQFQYYAVKDANGNMTNYVKLRDLAQALNGTKAQFNVGWDGKISITSNTAYEVKGGEGSTPYSGDQPYTAVSNTPVSFNGSDVNLTSFQLKDSAGNGYTYYKLRDLGQLLNFNVMWNGSSIVVESDKPYTG